MLARKDAESKAFNALIWQRAPKEMHSSLPTVETAVHLAVSYFNDGVQSICRVLAALGISPGFYCAQGCQYMDDERLRFATYNISDKAKKRRRHIRNVKKGYAERQVEVEGPPYL